jgi:hypothetical protein
MARRRVESQIAYLTSDQKKSRIDPIYLATRGFESIPDFFWSRVKLAI